MHYDDQNELEEKGNRIVTDSDSIIKLRFTDDRVGNATLLVRTPVTLSKQDIDFLSLEYKSLIGIALLAVLAALKTDQVRLLKDQLKAFIFMLAQQDADKTKQEKKYKRSKVTKRQK